MAERSISAAYIRAAVSCVTSSPQPFCCAAALSILLARVASQGGENSLHLVDVCGDSTACAAVRYYRALDAVAVFRARDEYLAPRSRCGAIRACARRIWRSGGIHLGFRRDASPSSVTAYH